MSVAMMVDMKTRYALLTLISLILTLSSVSKANECEYIQTLKDQTIKMYRMDVKAKDMMFSIGDITIESAGMTGDMIDDAFQTHIMDLDHFAKILGCVNNK